MSTQCPICSKVNPADAVYCYYDGRSLVQGAQEGPMQFGVMPFPMPFCFPDGHSCANFNQLALACDERWNEARTLLRDGIWKMFFSTMGRLDLATLATQAATEVDADVGFTQLLEKFPADADALRPPKVAVLSAEEDLGTVEPGQDHKFEVHIVNQGMFLLRGSVATDCDWLFFGEHPGGPSSRVFQTRHSYTLRVRVLGHKLRAGLKPLEGQIVIETNGGSITLPVRANVPVRPFPKGQYANDVLAGAKSPRELAQKAKAHPQEAALLFEQGAVKAWYASNGWTYPIPGTQAKGKGAVQQFFEALGLTKPPALEINTARILCAGKVGQLLTEHVTISTKESRFVYAHAWSNQDWITVGPGESKGNSVTIPLRIEIPNCPGTILQADVTFQGNGKQQFVVPVTLEVAAFGILAEPKKAEGGSGAVGAAPTPGAGPIRTIPPSWLFAGLGLMLLILVVVAWAVSRPGGKTPDRPGKEDPNANGVVLPRPKSWWDNIPDTKLQSSLAELKEKAPVDHAIFDGIAHASDVERGDWYKKLEPRMEKLADNANARVPLGRFVTACCVYDPDGLVAVRALAKQFPRDDEPFRPQEKMAELTRAIFWLEVALNAMTHKDIASARAKNLGYVFGVALDSTLPPDKLKARMETLLAERCYANTVPTAANVSLDFALAIRKDVIQKFPKRLAGDFKGKVDLELILKVLEKGNDPWAKLEPIAKICLEKKDVDTDLLFKLMDKLGKEKLLRLDQLNDLRGRTDVKISRKADEILQKFEEDLPYLVKRLSRGQPKERPLAREALLRFPERWRMKDPAPAGSDIPALKDIVKTATEKGPKFANDKDLLLVAVDGLSRLLESEPEEVVPELVKLAKKKELDAEIRKHILLALAGMKKPAHEALELIGSNLKHPDVGVCMKLSLALLKNDSKLLDGRQAELVTRCRDGLKQGGSTRLLCMDVLTEFNDKKAGADAWEELVPLLKAKDKAEENEAWHAVRAIKAIGCPRKAVPALVDFARFWRKSPAARQALALVCKEHPDNDFVKEKGIGWLIDGIVPDGAGLAECLADPDLGLKKNPSAQALLDLGPQGVKKLAEVALKDRGPKINVEREPFPTSRRLMAYSLLALYADKARDAVEGQEKDMLIKVLKEISLDVKGEEELYKIKDGVRKDPLKLYQRTYNAANRAVNAISILRRPN